ncbi:MAG: hypothetical protein JRN58_02635 [Nitrososphaerota archaeon]|jgi:hypothetical protein|nr:hypothetical protein [Nitrososphaerota archaeon]MDG6966798.1 hypothetical protein [Nitrososphaerota archaeon]MDG6977958.1 hypothetical protein [Nitrososphaerota archaeon]
MISETALLLAAASVGILHMSAPDHWATLIILGRTSRWSRPRLMEVGAMTALGHTALSVLLGFAIVFLGIVFSKQVSTYVTDGIGLAMVVGGLSYATKVLRTSKEEDFEKETAEMLARGEGRFGRRFGYFAVLGAALSPDLAILPIFLVAVPAGWGMVLGTAAVFAFASVGALLTFLLMGMAGLAKAFERVPPKYNDALVGFVVAAVGAYVLVAG